MRAVGIASATLCRLVTAYDLARGARGRPGDVQKLVDSTAVKRLSVYLRDDAKPSHPRVNTKEYRV